MTMPEDELEKTLDEDEAAILQCRARLEITPLNFHAMHDLAVALAKADRTLEAVTAYEDLFDNCDDAEVIAKAIRSLCEFGDHYTSEQDLVTACIYYEVVVGIDPDNFIARLGIGMFYFLQGNLVKAMTEVEVAIASEPQNTDALFLKASILYRVAMMDDRAVPLCMELLHKIRKIDPAHAEAAHLLAQFVPADSDEVTELMDQVVPIEIGFGAALRSQIDPEKSITHSTGIPGGKKPQTN